VFGAAACGGDIAPSTALPSGTPIAIADTARLRLGVISGDSIQEFDRVVTPFLLADGRVVVPLRGKSVIRVFAPDGSHQATLGRYGEGPGEFTALAGAWARGDTIEAIDFMERRIIRFLPDGSSQTIVLTGGGRTDVAIPGTAGDGWALLRIDAAGMGQRDQMSVQLFDRAGAYLGEAAKVEGMLRQSSSAGGGGPSPLSPRARYVLHDGTIYLAETFDAVIRAFPPAGDSARQIRWDPGPLPDPEVALRAAIQAAVAMAPADQAEQRRILLEGFPPPERVSAFWDLLVDDRGFFWIRPFDPSKNFFGAGPQGTAGSGGEWLIVSPAGAVVGSVTVPVDLELTQITEDAVIGIARDELGVEYVRVHPLERR
jgi:hypothetical protein